MHNVEETIHIYGRSFVLKSYDSNHDLQKVATILNEEMEKISKNIENKPAFTNVLLAAALSLAQRTIEQEKEIEALSNILEGE